MGHTTTIACALLAALAGCGRDVGEGNDGNDGGSHGGSDDGGPGASSCPSAPPRTYDPLASWTPPSLAATLTVTTAADAGPGSLRDALAQAPDGAVIGFAPALAGATITVASTLEPRRSVTIDGSAAPGITLDGHDAVRIFGFNGDDPTALRFFALHFTHGRVAGSGGAISLNGGHLTIEIAGCRFDHNVSSQGGAVRVGYALQSSTDVHDSVFTDNDGSLVNGNDTDLSAGAVSAIGTELRVRRCRFENNRGPISGALYEVHSDPVLEDSVFIHNTATNDDGAGAYFTDGGGSGDYNDTSPPPGAIIVRRTRFENNLGKGVFGGAALLYAYPKDTVTVEDTLVLANEAMPGRGAGFVLHADLQIDIRRTAFVNNHTLTQGGAIWGDGEGAMTFENVLFSGNVLDQDRGGALNLKIGETGKLLLSHVTFVDNTAGSGVEALWLPGMRDVTIRNSIVANSVITHAYEGQINFPIADGGGNLEWPTGDGIRRSLPSALLADPRLEPLAAIDGTMVRPLAADSPAIGAATAPAAAVDQRGFARDAHPDSGAFELGATCAQ